MTGKPDTRRSRGRHLDHPPQPPRPRRLPRPRPPHPRPHPGPGRRRARHHPPVPLRARERRRQPLGPTPLRAPRHPRRRPPPPGTPMTTVTAWLYGTPVATLAPTTTRTTDGTPRVTLTWTPDALHRWGHHARVLSHLLPVTPPDEPGPHPARVAAWLDGLLPEGRTRDAMAIDAGIDPDDALAFLVHYGHDTAGAVLLAPHGQPLPPPGTPERLDDAAVARLLRAAVARSGGEGRTDHLTSSLPGMEPKITLLHDEHGWARPHGTAPTTHILKVARPS